MTVFYRGPCVRITHKVFETRCPTYRCYALEDLRDVHVVERTADPPSAVGSARIASTGTAGAVAVAIAIGRIDRWEAFDSPLTMLGMVVLLIVSVAVSGACWWITSEERELVAIYHNELVTLHQSADPQEFGQVMRALTRALERLDDIS